MMRKWIEEQMALDAGEQVAVAGWIKGVVECTRR